MLVMKEHHKTCRNKLCVHNCPVPVVLRSTFSQGLSNDRFPLQFLIFFNLHWRLKFILRHVDVFTGLRITDNELIEGNWARYDHFWRAILTGENHPPCYDFTLPCYDFITSKLIFRQYCFILKNFLTCFLGASHQYSIWTDNNNNNKIKKQHWWMAESFVKTGEVGL